MLENDGFIVDAIEGGFVVIGFDVGMSEKEFIDGLVNTSDDGVVKDDSMEDKGFEDESEVGVKVGSYEDVQFGSDDDE